jgi:dTDP-4-dehydrorhamnose reductase
LAREQEELRVVNDQYGCPTYAGDLAEAILDITGQILRSRPISWGTYHYCGQGVVSRYDFAQKICEVAKNYVPLRVKEIKAVSTAEYPAAARRPPYSALDCRKIGEAIGVKFRNWQDSLTEFLARFFQENYPGEKCVNERHACDQP